MRQFTKENKSKAMHSAMQKTCAFLMKFHVTFNLTFLRIKVQYFARYPAMETSTSVPLISVLYLHFDCMFDFISSK